MMSKTPKKAPGHWCHHTEQYITAWVLVVFSLLSYTLSFTRMLTDFLSHTLATCTTRTSKITPNLLLAVYRMLFSTRHGQILVSTGMALQDLQLLS